uniref:ATP synthase subunit a n=1 Tax=Codonobdella sp. IK-2021 TaxID=2848640 RepID=A0A8F2E633_9ANNE|nr:ATP synthase F0 subunit 6 [Codonobdella sp. B45A]QWT29633.1 ATP synthase F0 subunit 6 [Codonobdella sp. IK-2021]UTS56342.1 ATP synthase F0 subunit 6 [Codonobdella sp. B45A]
MLMDIFSSFDIFEFNGFKSISPMIIMTLSMAMMMYMYSMIWMKKNKVQTMFLSPKSLILKQLNSTMLPNMGGIMSLVSTLFITIIMINILGLIPMTFSITSHLIMTVLIGLPMWMMIVSSSAMNNKKEFVGKLLPDGAPMWLNPFLVLIETVSISVRPITLSVRLAANMSAGHIVLSLIGIYVSSALNLSIMSTMLLMSIYIGYMLFEVAICMIQAYIFCLLISLYSDDHTQ